MPITIKLDQFEGPLDLLLYLIHSQELDISKVSIARVTDQYLAFIRLMRELDFDLASEFLVMASTLVHWKSRALLPPDENETTDENAEDEMPTQEDLVRQLLEHRRFLQAGNELSQISLLGEEVFTRPNSKPPVEKVWKEMNVTSLATTFQDILVRSRKRKQVLRKETVSVTGKMAEFGDKLTIGEMVELVSLFTDRTRPEMVVTFLASLEMSRIKKLKMYQQKTYDPIYVELVESLEKIDLELSSFDQKKEESEKGAIHELAK